MPKRAAPDSPAELDNAKISCRADFQEIAARYHRDQLVLIEGGGAAADLGVVDTCRWSVRCGTFRHGDVLPDTAFTADRDLRLA